MIEIKNLSCAFNTKTILQNINLNIQSHLCILGANGSGKSTLAKAVCGLIEQGGEVSINATNIKELSLIQKARLISYIPAKLEIYDSFISVEEFVLLGRFPYKRSFFEYSDKDKNIVQETLDFLKISHLKEHPLSSLSSGEQQLTLIAQALAQESEIMIFDEPTANLDPHNTKIIAQYIKGLKEHHQVILITHDLHLASYFDADVAFIKNKALTLYTQNFFNDATLSELYDVKFKGLVAQYD